MINVGIRQMPGLTKLRLTRDGEGNARGGEVYYHRGDIIRYSKDGRLYLCISIHQHGEQSRWISFDATQEEVARQAIGTCNWRKVGQDTVYSKPQASAHTLALWVDNFLFSDVGYNNVIEHLGNAALVSDRYIGQLVPPRNYRDAVIRGLVYQSPAKSAILEAWKKVGDDQEVRTTKADSPWSNTFVNHDPVVMVYYPHKL